jgi:hypothetical protein
LEFRDSLAPSRRGRCSPTTRPPALGSSASLGSDALSVRKRSPAEFVCAGSLLKLVVLRSRLQERAL